MPRDIRSDRQKSDDRKAAQQDRAGVVSYERTGEYVSGKGNDLRPVEGPPKVDLADRLFTELQRVADYAEADADSVSFSITALVELTDGQKNIITVTKFADGERFTVDNPAVPA